jgi:hypothetical protein
MGFGQTGRHRREPALGPRREATAHENTAAFQVSSASVRLDYLSAKPFVGFDSPRRNGRGYVGLRGFFLLANARSRLRR